MKSSRPEYPFVPKSAAWLLPGQYWALPMSDGSFGCGRVIQLAPASMRGARVMFLAAVLDWISSSQPTSESIAGAGCLGQGQVHIKAITETGGEVLGYRSLELDRIVPWFFRGASAWQGSLVTEGLVPARPQTTQDEDLPVLTMWGYDVVRKIAEAQRR